MFNILVDAKAEIATLQLQMESLKEKNAVLEKTNQNVKYIFALYSNSFKISQYHSYRYYR